MSVVIIINGSGGARTAIDNANQAASTYSWTQAQIDAMAATFQSFTSDVQKKILSYNAGNPP